MDELPITERTRIRRRPQRGSVDRALLDAILDQGLLVHVGFATDAGPVVIPTTYVRLGRELYIHGSPASRMLKAGAGGVELCAAVTLLDGLVLARSAFHHSMNYRSAIAFGRARVVTDPAEKGRVLAALLERLVPGRGAVARAPTAEELRGTLVLALPLDEASVKVRSGPPIDDEADLALPVWAGEIPLAPAAGDPIAAPGTAGSPPERVGAGIVARAPAAVPAPRDGERPGPPPRPVAAAHGAYVISDDRSRLDLPRVATWLEDAYWCPGIPPALVERAARRSSLVAGAYAADGQQVGYLRAISDGVRFAYFMDIFVAEPHRGRGLGRALVRFALGHPEHRDVVRWLLGTKDAHGVYATEGFTPLAEPGRFMERMGVWPYPAR